jgi:hypothetical protein
MSKLNLYKRNSAVHDVLVANQNYSESFGEKKLIWQCRQQGNSILTCMDAR